ncbi:unnamed protein product [Auanema sp. JU1783]|nr:unnamed protein product [Auanema sp. JU1783]
MIKNRNSWLDSLSPTPPGVFAALKRDGNPATDSLRAILLLVLFSATFFSCLGATVLRGGGVFLATCLLDLLPEGLESFEKAGIEMEFPIAEAAIVAGFLMVLTIEQIVVAAQEKGWLSGGHLHDHHHDTESLVTSDPEDEAPKENVVGSILLVFAISLHALFEGLSVAVITEAPKLLQIAAALFLHKVIIGFSVGVRLVESNMRTIHIAICAFCLSVQVLIGGFGGIGLMDVISGGNKSTAALVACILQGVACGTFLYITTFEVLPHEISKPGKRLAKLCFIYIGVFVVISFMAIFGDV